MADFERLTETELRDALADVECMISGEWYKIDVEVAVAEYFFRPERFHATSHDNPEGDPVRELVFTDGPWWVPEVSRFDGWAEPGDHGPPLDFFPLWSDEGAALPLPSPGMSHSALVAMLTDIAEPVPCEHPDTEPVLEGDRVVDVECLLCGTTASEGFRA